MLLPVRGKARSGMSEVKITQHLCQALEAAGRVALGGLGNGARQAARHTLDKVRRALLEADLVVLWPVLVVVLLLALPQEVRVDRGKPPAGAGGDFADGVREPVRAVADESLGAVLKRLLVAVPQRRDAGAKRAEARACARLVSLSVHGDVHGMQPNARVHAAPAAVLRAPAKIDERSRCR